MRVGKSRYNSRPDGRKKEEKKRKRSPICLNTVHNEDKQSPREGMILSRKSKRERSVIIHKTNSDPIPFDWRRTFIENGKGK